MLVVGSIIESSGSSQIEDAHAFDGIAPAPPLGIESRRSAGIERP
jgi:hypothetical protein